MCIRDRHTGSTAVAAPTVPPTSSQTGARTSPHPAHTPMGYEPTLPPAGRSRRRVRNLDRNFVVRVGPSSSSAPNLGVAAPTFAVPSGGMRDLRAPTSRPAEEGHGPRKPDQQQPERSRRPTPVSYTHLRAH